jgi:hypothetical protein
MGMSLTDKDLLLRWDVTGRLWFARGDLILVMRASEGCCSGWGR